MSVSSSDSESPEGPIGFVYPEPPAGALADIPCYSYVGFPASLHHWLPPTPPQTQQLAAVIDAGPAANPGANHINAGAKADPGANPTEAGAEANSVKRYECAVCGLDYSRPHTTKQHFYREHEFDHRGLKFDSHPSMPQGMKPGQIEQGNTRTMPKGDENQRKKRKVQDQVVDDEESEGSNDEGSNTGKPTKAKKARR